MPRAVSSVNISEDEEAKAEGGEGGAVDLGGTIGYDGLKDFTRRRKVVGETTASGGGAQATGGFRPACTEKKERFWDPDGDTYSIDNNEGSEQGLDVHADVYELVDELERYTSAVDYATPRLASAQRGEAVPRRHPLDCVRDDGEEETISRRRKSETSERGSTPAPVIGEVIKTIACDLDEGPKVMRVIRGESARQARAEIVRGATATRTGGGRDQAINSLSASVRGHVRGWFDRTQGYCTWILA